ncbi:hypothetical protein [Thermococcus stetteri]|uniref:hypothetical protein n=1 Tax=Thermococcus stetteri TaxID=49900 RepID=UPI001AE9976F|nr:hypothetical protein [Thermococcus stetteri]MBP1912089.1 energy-coupling factor transporter transmembrane protein EcfT [Thermococcus stetteri]
MAVEAETGKEIAVGLVAILLTLLFVLIAFLLHNVVWIIVGMLFTVGYLLWVAEAHGVGFFNRPKVKS